MADHDGKIHIWAISTLYLPNFSGAAIQTHKVLKRFIHKEFSAVVLTSGDYAARDLRGIQVNRDGVVVKYLPIILCKDWRFLKRTQLLYKIANYLTALLHSLSMGILCAWVLWRDGQRGDIVQIQSPDEFSFLPVWIARLRGMHPVIHLNLLGSDDPASIIERVRRGRVIEAIKLEAFRGAEAIVSIATALTNSCLATGIPAEKVVQIPHGIDVDEFRPANREERATLQRKLGLNLDRRYIVFVGATVARKGIDVLIKAYIQVHQKLGNARLLIVGPCDFTNGVFGDPSQERRLLNELKDQLEAAGCSSYVHWIGRVDNVHDYMRAADIFCLPTRREGFGIVVIEAMAAGLPVVVARLEGVTTDIIRSDREGILIEGHNPDDYAKAILRLLQDEVMARAMGNAARARTVEEFSLEQIVEHYAELYRELAGVTCFQSERQARFILDRDVPGSSRASNG